MGTNPTTLMRPLWHAYSLRNNDILGGDDPCLTCHRPRSLGTSKQGIPRPMRRAAAAYAKASRPWYKKKRLLGVIVLIVIIVMASSGGDGGSTDSGSDNGSGDSGSGDKSTSKPVKVEASQILKEFEENEAAADGKYKDKTLQVTGVVSKVDTEFIDEDEYVVQVGAGTDFDFITVNCDDQSADAVSSLKKGDDITVVGDFEDGGDLGVELKNCKIA